MSVFMVGLHIWIVVFSFCIGAKTDRPAPARGNMAAPAAAACDGDHRFRTIQNDSDSAACGKRGALPRPAP